MTATISVQAMRIVSIILAIVGALSEGVGLVVTIKGAGYFRDLAARVVPAWRRSSAGPTVVHISATDRATVTETALPITVHQAGNPDLGHTHLRVVDLGNRVSRLETKVELLTMSTTDLAKTTEAQHVAIRDSESRIHSVIRLDRQNVYCGGIFVLVGLAMSLAGSIIGTLS